MQACGGDLKDIVSVTVFVRDITQFSAIHEVRREYFPVDPPASTMVEVSRLVDERSLIEINAVAVLP
jgi:enamine deaminase RidA (YjgF/YER057c/UK114 family)